MFLLPKAYWRMEKTPNRGRGIFAQKHIPAGSVIGDYIGRIVDQDDEDDSEGLYGMCFHDTAAIEPVDRKSIDIHLINHACMPNCAIYPYEGHMLFMALRQIFPNEELTVDYLVDPADAEDDEGPHYPCYCGMPLCRGTMQISAEKAKAFEIFIKAQQKEKYYTNPASMGEEMLPLDKYPEKIPDNDVYDLYGNLKEKPTAMKDMPDMATIRKTIRDTGRCITITSIHMTVVGVKNGTFVILQYNDSI